jgi:hypothetical protein
MTMACGIVEATKSKTLKAVTKSCLSDERIWKIYGKKENIGTTARIFMEHIS